MVNKYIPIFLLILLFVPLSQATADSQLDIGVNIPVVIGVSLNGQNVSESLPFTLPIPDITYQYNFGTEQFRFGLGMKVWSVIIVTAGYPILGVEIELDPLIISANIGGGFFLYTSIGGSGAEFGEVFIPEVFAGVKLADWFILGASFLGVYVPDVTESGFGYTINVVGRFRVL